MNVLQPPGWPRPSGYANGIETSGGRQIFLAGMVGWDGQQRWKSDDLVGQVEQALRNVVDVLAESGASPGHICRMTWDITSRVDYLANTRAIGEVYRRVIGHHYPAMSVIEVGGLIEERAVVEVEVTAVIEEES